MNPPAKRIRLDDLCENKARTQSCTTRAARADATISNMPTVNPCLPADMFSKFYNGDSPELLTLNRTFIIAIPCNYTVGRFWIDKIAKEEERCGLPGDDKFCGPGCQRSGSKTNKMLRVKTRPFCDRKWFVPDKVNPNYVVALPNLPAKGFSWQSIMSDEGPNVKIRTWFCKKGGPRGTCDQVINGVFSDTNPSVIKKKGPVFLENGKIKLGQKLSRHQSMDYSARLLAHEKNWCTSTCVLGGHGNRTCCSLFVLKEPCNHSFWSLVGYTAPLWYNGSKVTKDGAQVKCCVIPGLKQDQIARLLLGKIRCPLSMREACSKI